MKTYIYLHLCAIGPWKKITENQLTKIKSSGLYDYIDEMRVCLYGNSFEVQQAKSLLRSYLNHKLNIRFESDDISLREKKTLEILSEDSHNEDDFKVFYLHSKGVSPKFDQGHRGNRECIADWVDFMLYFNVMRWNECVDLLDKYDTCGVELQTDGRSYTKGLHYSGNFWWANSTHIKKLRKVVEALHSKPRLDVEQWLCSENFYGVELASSPNLDLYVNRYPPSLYENDGIIIREEKIMD
jgi:hypothetical protein